MYHTFDRAKVEISVSYVTPHPWMVLWGIAHNTPPVIQISHPQKHLAWRLDAAWTPGWWWWLLKMKQRLKHFQGFEMSINDLHGVARDCKVVIKVLSVVKWPVEVEEYRRAGDKRDVSLPTLRSFKRAHVLVILCPQAGVAGKPELPGQRWILCQRWITASLDHQLTDLRKKEGLGLKWCHNLKVETAQS